MDRFTPRVCKRWFPNVWFESCSEVNVPYPLLTEINPLFTLFNLILTSLLTLCYLNLTSPLSGVSNHGLETTAYRFSLVGKLS